jgi:hypothetical protein
VTSHNVANSESKVALVATAAREHWWKGGWSGELRSHHSLLSSTRRSIMLSRLHPPMLTRSPPLTLRRSSTTPLLHHGGSRYQLAPYKTHPGRSNHHLQLRAQKKPVSSTAFNHRNPSWRIDAVQWVADHVHRFRLPCIDIVPILPSGGHLPRSLNTRARVFRAAPHGAPPPWTRWQKRGCGDCDGVGVCD